MPILQDEIDSINEEYDKTNARLHAKVIEIKKFGAEFHDFGMTKKDIADWNAGADVDIAVVTSQIEKQVEERKKVQKETRKLLDKYNEIFRIEEDTKDTKPMVSPEGAM